MARAGYCAECGANTWVNDDGTCARGHAASSVSGVYETEMPGPTPQQASRKKSGWAIAGIILLISLPVALLVCGILAAIAIPVFNAASGSAKQRACFSNQRVIEGSVQQWLANDPDAAAADLAGPVDGDNPILRDGVLTEAPRCQADPGTPYELDDQGMTTCPAGDPPAGHGRYTDAP